MPCPSLPLCPLCLCGEKSAKIRKSAVKKLSGNKSGIPAVRPCALSVRLKQEPRSGKKDGDLPDPEKKHPFDDLGFQLRAILFRHQAFGQVVLLFLERDFQRFCNGPRFRRLDLRGLQDAQNFRRAHPDRMPAIPGTVKSKQTPDNAGRCTRSPRMESSHALVNALSPPAGNANWERTHQDILGLRPS